MPKFRKIIKRTPMQSAEHETREHVLRDLADTESCVAFRFGQADSSMYAFTMVWTPAHIFIGGDIGEITFTHHHALAHRVAGLYWFAHSHADYLLGKSNAERVVDVERTVKTLRKWRSEPHGDGARARRVKFQDLIDTITSGDYGAHEVGRLIYEAGLDLDDYFGDHDYPRQAYFQLACAQLAARTWLASNAPSDRAEAA